MTAHELNQKPLPIASGNVALRRRMQCLHSLGAAHDECSADELFFTEEFVLLPALRSVSFEDFVLRGQRCQSTQAIGLKWTTMRTPLPRTLHQSTWCWSWILGNRTLFFVWRWSRELFQTCVYVPFGSCYRRPLLGRRVNNALHGTARF